MNKKYSYELEADVKNLELMLEPIEKELEELNVEHKTIYKIRLALEELFTNVANYAYQPGKGQIQIAYVVKDNPRSIEVTIKDNGKAFNPLESKEPDLDAKVEDRRIGGLGLFIVKNTMDGISYVRKDNQNILVIIKNI